MTRRRKKPGVQLASHAPVLPQIEERLEKIETKLAYLEDFVTRLQDTVVERNRELDRIQEEHRAMRSRLLQISQELETLPHEKPPHY
ncbi:MAG: SlyX family protein [Treponema sp.]|jgi:SlyX protein|nr:SlyX family protein [Treponema sp.]